MNLLDRMDVGSLGFLFIFSVLLSFAMGLAFSRVISCDFLRGLVQ